MSLVEQVAEFLTLYAIDIAKREPVDCIMRTCTSTRQCCFPTNCPRKSETPSQGVEP